MKDLLHKYRIMALKKQIKNDSEIPYYPFSISTYMHPESRNRLLKIIWEILKLKVLQLVK